MSPTLRCLVDGPAPGAWNMAVDETLMAGARDGRVTLRFYRWEPGCLSFGRNQTARGRYDGAAAARRGFDVVRRPTGGRSVLHHRELTYAVSAPAAAWGGLREAYARINRALAAGLRSLGVEAVVVGPESRARLPRPTVRACFRDPLPGEVVVGGRKLVGSAQWRDRDSLLQHGSILLSNEQATVEEMRIGDRSPSEIPAVGLTELLKPLPSPQAMAASLGAAFAAEFDLDLERAELDATERDAAERARRRYEDDRWTWRR